MIWNGRRGNTPDPVYPVITWFLSELEEWRIEGSPTEGKGMRFGDNIRTGSYPQEHCV